MTKYLFFLLLVYQAIQLTESSTHHCPYWANEKIHQCIKPVQIFAKTVNKKGTSISTNVTEDKFGDAFAIPKLGGQSSLIRKFDKCVMEPREECPKHVMISLIDASYGYLCNEGYEAFMSSAECLMDLDHKPSVKRCHDETLADIEKANDEVGITLPVKLDRMCEALNFFSGCVRTPIRHNCGVAAWAVIFRVLRDTTSSLLPNCQFTGQSSKLFSTTQSPPFKAYKPTVIQITPRITSNTFQTGNEELVSLSNRKTELRATRMQGHDSGSVYYSSKKSTSKQGDNLLTAKLASASSNLRLCSQLIFNFALLIIALRLTYR